MVKREKNLNFIFVTSIILAIAVSLQSCIIIPQTINIDDYFLSNIIAVTYQIDYSQEQGYTESITPKIIKLNLLTDDDESNVEFDNYISFSFGYKNEANNLEIKSVFFVLQVQADITMRFKLYFDAEQYVETEVEAKKDKKSIVMFEPDNAFKDAKESISMSIFLTNVLEVGAIKYSIDSVLIDAAIKE
jgi:hypothetical protein